MKVAICTIGRCENAYIREFLMHYQKINVDKVFLYDNNFDGEEYFEDVIQEFIDNEFVEVIPYRNKHFCQLQAYQHCYDTHKDEYDWFLFIDCDEYLYMTGFTDIKLFLAQYQYNCYDMIHINLMNYGDNDLVKQSDELLCERFKTPILPLDYTKLYNFPENDHIVSIIRGHLPEVKWDGTPHTPTNSLNCCDARGNKCISAMPFIHPFDFSAAHFKHYSTKTLEEYLKIKAKRGFPDGNKDYFKNNDAVKDFFIVNQITDEKLSYLKEVGYNYIDNLDIFIASHKAFTPIVKNPMYKIVYPFKIDNSNTKLQQLYGHDNFAVPQQFYCEIAMYIELPQLTSLKDYVGTCHYRRYFQFRDNIPDMNNIFKKYDAVVAAPLPFDITVLQQYGEVHNIEDLYITQGIVAEKYPEYNQAFKDVMNSKMLFPYNMFIMKKDNFLEYIDFVKNILETYLQVINFDVSKRIKDNSQKYLKDYYPNNTLNYQFRIGGCLAERLTNVYIFKNFKNMKSYEVLITENKY